MEALARALDARCHGWTVTRIELASFSALKTVRPRLEDLQGRRVLTCGRRGKFLLLELEPDWLVLHLARAGWVHWREPLPSARLRPGRNPTALRLGLRPEEAGGPAVGFDVTEAGTESRLALWAV
ncbi:MAG: DNA-formamidopyrimidine glycosylase family protein, partial [Candidatus Dormibacteria bacterium]